MEFLREQTITVNWIKKREMMGVTGKEMKFEEFDQWIKSIAPDIRVEHRDDYRTVYHLKTPDGKAIEVEAGSELEVYRIWFDGYYSYADIGYSTQEKRAILFRLNVL